MFQWEFLTLDTQNTSIDLIINDKNNFQIFLKFLIHSLRTVDGEKNTANDKFK
jgi:hypothetical protein